MKPLTVKDIAVAGMMLAIIEACKYALSFLPNIELTTFWIIVFTLYFGRKILFVIPAFILLEGSIYGFGLWWFMYLYAWPLLVLLTWIFRKQKSWLFWSILSCAFGLSFGFLCSFPYVLIGAADGSLRDGLLSGFTWWVAGIPWDIVHGIGNFVLMSILYVPMTKCMERISLK